MITKDDIVAARERIRPHVHVTPLLRSTRLGDAAGGIDLWLKCESLQRTGSFKARGALNAVMQLSTGERERGVVTVSAGNHAQALAWASAMVGAHCVTVMPEGSSKTKIKATEGYGAKVEIVGGERVRAFERAQEIAAQGRVMVHPFEDPRVASGQGTVALEVLEQTRDVDAVVVPIGGGGLISGISTAIKAAWPKTRVIGVEPSGAATMRASLDAGKPMTISPKTIADGLAAPMVGAMTLETTRRNVDDVVLVNDDEILAALRDVLAYARLVIEPAAAASVAALITGKIPVSRGARVVAVLSGGNVDLDRLKTLL
ncbi:MAG TPA: threonine/serine dehydratase [Gemmatimonadaceae bacterium]|nr:threonine/serine dehydratase [Gemmatimonadaceae bacterium]